ncbi:hypothetical protein ACHAXR_012913 [Thalassiosira sp. AJA248-18]
MNNKKYKAMPNIARLKLEAIFHPKFENETPDSEIRQKMLARVSAHQGYLEASLKHSGSLLLWSGRQCFYSKNSTGNVFTRVGEIMLMQHFARCFGSSNNWREEYERCSEFVHQNRLTCSFEVVTSILGHHGDLPKRDYLILIAVADRGCGRGKFYSSNELVRFAHKFRLPHNDAWVFSSSVACESLFHSYDKLRETGTATTVINKLDRIIFENEGGGCAKVASLYPHDIFQGDILEGIVIRYVPYTTSAESDRDNARQSCLDELKELGSASNKLLRLVPPSKTVHIQVENLGNDTIQNLDLRTLAAMDDFDHQVEDVLRNMHGQNMRHIQRGNDNPDDGETSTPTACINVVNIANEILSSSSTCSSLYDQETLDIAQLIQSLDQLKIHISYKIIFEKIGVEERLLCILHIIHDSAFPKYTAFLRRGRSKGMMLFRGFSIELVPAGGDISKNNETEKTDVDASIVDVESIGSEEKLMLKMKFLPYMVRTFICRNGLPILRRSGEQAFENHAIKQLSKWGVSDASVRKWMSFFKGWAMYCSSPLSTSLPPLTEREYLHHYNEYNSLYSNGKFQSSPAEESSFNGLIVIVGLSKIKLEPLLLSVSKELHCSRIVRDIHSITDKDVLLSLQQPGGGLICIAEIEGGFGNLRNLAKQNQEAIYIILVEADLEETADTDINRLRKIKGMTQGWRKTKCNMLLDLPSVAAAQPDANATLEYLRNDPTAKAVMEKLKESSNKNQRDERPGLIIYFPSIPGSGKSSLCQSITANSLGMGDDRQLILMEGDQVKGKFYNVVRQEVLTKPASVALLDKNVPPTSFSSVHTLCVEGKSIALPVLSAGMKDTWVGKSVSSHVYPFSLQHLAACMSRVLIRQPNTHNGKLDSATEKACMVVVKFYCFYRNMTAALLKEKLLNIGYHGKAITIPFLKDDTIADLPTDLKSALEDSIVLQTREDMNCKASNEEMIDAEKRLRSSIQEHQTYINSLTVSLAESKKVFISELSRVIASLPDKVDANCMVCKATSGTIKIASLDLNYEVVHSEIEKLRKSVAEVDEYFARRNDHKNNDENDKSQNRFITSLHCTFAHASQVTQATMVSTFQHLLGTAAEITAVSILFNDKIAAIELEIPDESSIPRPQNIFSHVTIWCGKDTEAHESNELLEKLKCNDAKRVAFEQPVAMSGVFSFWYY